MVLSMLNVVLNVSKVNIIDSEQRHLSVFIVQF